MTNLIKIAFVLRFPQASLRTAICVSVLLLSYTLLTHTFALDPPPGGAYPGQTTALGQDALFNETDDTNVNNTAIGFEALYSNTLGVSNTGVGSSVLHDNTGGEGNSALGDSSLTSNTTGDSNTAVGAYSLRYNTSGSSNTAIGESALTLSNGDSNTVMGLNAMFFNTEGSYNVSVGVNSLSFNTVGTRNVGLGYGALNQNVSGSYNIAVGTVSGSKVTTGSFNIDIGNQGTRNDNRTIRIGAPKAQKNVYISGITGVTVAGGVGVVIDNEGHLGTVNSSARYKEAIKPMDKSSEAILALKPVSFRYKKELDPQAIPQFGLLAEEVAKVDPDLVAKDEEGKPYTVRYEAVNAMLLNEFLKEHRTVQDQNSEIRDLKQALAEQEKAMATLQAEVKEIRQRQQ